jgi:hypothetical protein
LARQAASQVQRKVGQVLVRNHENRATSLYSGIC